MHFWYYSVVRYLVIMLYFVQISDTQIKPIKDNRFVSKIFVDVLLTYFNVYECTLKSRITYLNRHGH